ncbi:prolyl 3-hydroxylase OGFOD1 isoform 2 [Mus musculus]|uniref:Isoform 2 of Prolyl 3-hydroxylase OGFOD1 n=1 Tax=Mus musculus TaxID=10090 RepID=Q3U0K8-2|nr:prolyl 3-hydroxylase OGFOD1 isoform 2 [Mus musculus]|eukprot:NP_001087226.1 prolyl 3-hydroxylase OGFOD1 isoform 2 [Mus musculus]
MNGKRPADPGPARPMKKGKKQVSAEFSDAVTEEILRKQVAEAWSCRTPFSHEAIALDMDPFLHCVIPNFIQSQDFLEGLHKELLSLDFHEKYNDLYKFQQSDDLKNRKEPHISALRKLMFEDFRAWLSKVSGIDLEPTIDMSCAKYEFTDALLCHDDELEGRRIAFILYLVPSWDRDLGGTLDLYDTDEHLQPKQIVKSLIPSWNKLVFFEVSPVSFHQHEILYEWINPAYLEMDYQMQIQEEFEERSEILLKEFLKPEKFAEVCEALEKGDVEWKSHGPPNKRFYEKAEENNLPDVLKECMGLFRSEALFLLLSNLTGLKLHFLAPSEDDETEEKGEGETASAAAGTEEGTSRRPSGPENNQVAAGSHSQENGEQADPEAQEEEAKKESSVPMCQGELRRWKTGHYTLVHDNTKTEFALDLFLYCGCEGWEPEYGGFTSYIAKGEDEELLIVNPENNSLALVYRDRETLRFVKHINHRSLEQSKAFPSRSGFWDFAFIYYE